MRMSIHDVKNIDIQESYISGAVQTIIITDEKGNLIQIDCYTNKESIPINIMS